MWTIPLSALDYDDQEAQAVAGVLASRWLSMGPETEAFEQEFAGAHGLPHAVAVHSGTAALYLALRACGIGPGDEVLLPSLTFVATANVVLQCGAKPVFADIESAERPLLDPKDVARRITPQTRAILPVHYGGSLCDMGVLRQLADDHDLALIEDAAHASGTTNVGISSDASCFSFYANKNLATGEGGMVLTRDEGIAERCRSLRSHGRGNSSHDKASGNMAADDVSAPGVNARIGEIASALGRVQLRKLTAGNQRRRELRQRYAEALEGSDVTIPLAGDEATSACHLMVVALPLGSDRDKLRATMAADGIQTSVHYLPVHKFSAFAPYTASLPITEALAPRLLSLPLHAQLTDDEVSTVVTCLLAALAKEEPNS